jgi:hypothetical protein
MIKRNLLPRGLFRTVECMDCISRHHQLGVGKKGRQLSEGDGVKRIIGR